MGRDGMGTLEMQANGRAPRAGRPRTGQREAIEGFRPRGVMTEPELWLQPGDWSRAKNDAEAAAALSRDRRAAPARRRRRGREGGGSRPRGRPEPSGLGTKPETPLRDPNRRRHNAEAGPHRLCIGSAGGAQHPPVPTHRRTCAPSLRPRRKWRDVTSGPAPAGPSTVADRLRRCRRAGRCSCLPRCTPAWPGAPVRRSLCPWSVAPRPAPRPSASRRARCASRGSTSSSRVPEFTCQVAGCCQVFDALEDYEHHYHTLHRNVCSFCKRAFPSGHLLDIHILEWHDSLFQILSERQNMYQCLVEGCTEKFKTSKDRKDHLVRRHLYPADFRFDKPKKNMSPATPRATVQVSAEALGAEGEQVEGDAMEVCSEPAGERHTAGRRIPPTICFGQGASRGFKSTKKRNKHQ
uniref:Zinc finger protein 511 n=1 Tax=Equus caballus TaxID=9796 RepID=F7ABA2_HORSE